MTLLRAAFAAVALALAVPAIALGSDRFVVRNLPVGSDGTVQARYAQERFNLVGLHWKGLGAVWFRTASSAGAWSGWREAAMEAEDRPDAGSAEGAARQGWKVGSPYWTGPAVSIQYRFEGPVSKLRAYFIWSDSRAGTSLPPGRIAARAARPTIIRRAEWGADESIVRAKPSYASAVHFAVVHHTAGTNSYSASDSAAIVRGIERYHVLANGWNDIGYNFLVDKYGQVFEGRAGGITRNVVGAHAEGFNTGSTGVALMGNHETRKISGAARAALVKLLAWRLDVAHVNPLGKLTWTSGGNPKYPAGTKVKLRAVSGHRDTGPTSCPGGSLYAKLPGIAADVAVTGLPKLYRPVVTGGLGGPVRFTATLTEALPWTVTIRDSAGSVVADGSGTGTAVDWTWDASAVPYGDFTYSMEAGQGLRPARGQVPGPPPLEVTSLTARPHTVTPNGDGLGEATSVSFSLSSRASVAVEVLDSSAQVVRTLASSFSYSSGRASLIWNGRNAPGHLVRDGRYRIRITATSLGQQARKSHGVLVDRTLGHLEVAPTPFSPDGDGRLDSTAIGFRLARNADVRVRVMDGERTVATVHRLGTLAGGPVSLPWLGRNRHGVVRDAQYRAVVEATTILGTRVLSLPLAIDTRDPVVRIVSARHRKDGRTAVRLWLSEAATVRVRYGSPELVGLRELHRQAGYSRVRLPRATRVRARAEDAAANVGPRVTARVGS
jgi:N-acetylmuramoyl-L-alanine amidase/FlgD Ig-like domain